MIKVKLEQKHIDMLEFLVNKEIQFYIKEIKKINEGKSTVIGKESYREIYSRHLENYKVILTAIQQGEYIGYRIL